MNETPWKLPLESEAVEEIDKAFQQYKEDLEEEYSNCSSEVSPYFSHAAHKHKPQNEFLSGQILDYESFDIKAKKYDDEIPSGFYIINYKFWVISLIVFISSILAFMCIATLVIDPPYIDNLVPVVKDVQASIVAPGGVQSPDIKNIILGNIEHNMYPSSYSIFAKNSDVIENPIPILFDITRGPGLLFFPRALGCLPFKQISWQRHINTVKPGEYFHTHSLCDLANNHDKNLGGKKLKIFAVLRNPIVSSILLHRQITNPANNYFEKEFDGLTIQDFMKDSTRNNVLTRSIVCKSKDEKLTEEDYNNAKEFLSTRCIVEIHDGRGEKALKRFLQMFKNKEGGLSTIEDSEECVNNTLTNAQAITRSVSATQDRIRNNIKDLEAANDFDMKLYFHMSSLSNDSNPKRYYQ